jgi:hypothetical protein
MAASSADAMLLMRNRRIAGTRAVAEIRAAALEGRAEMTGSNLSRMIAPIVTIISLTAWLIWPAYPASRRGRKANYVPRHARPRKITRRWGS